MTILYVHEQGTRLRKKDHRLLVKRGEEVIQEVPLGKLEQVVVMGRGVQLSTALLVDLLERGIPVILTNQRGSRHYATLAGSPSRFGELRTKQMFFVYDPEQALALARSVVQAKLHNQQALLQATGWRSATVALQHIAQAMRDLAAAPTIDMVRGYEGSAAAAYFGAWRVALDTKWEFKGRMFYPPPDPINAMLSFGYTMLLHDVMSAVQVAGLDPYLGTFHVAEPGRPSLVLDMMEEFRPLIVDYLVLNLVQGNMLDHSRFERPSHRDDAVYLDSEGRTFFVNQYEQMLHKRVTLPTGDETEMRRVITLQVQAVARVVRGEQQEYVGYRA